VIVLLPILRHLVLKMKVRSQLWMPLLVVATSITGSAAGQDLSTRLPMVWTTQQAPEDGAQTLLAFKESDIKFRLQNLMDILRDHQHEGWVLAAYPDPNTGRPLIGAGFSLDVPAMEHPQRDPLNPYTFVEPSAAQLWQAAGLPPERLQHILDQFDHNAATWSPTTYRRKIVRHTLTPQLTDEEATRLLRISAIQAIYNARAYCRGFDRLTASQQMALSQLVFQMGTNLGGFVQFLDAVNDEDNAHELAKLDGYLETYTEHWQRVQSTLIDSQWARRYSVRATAVIAMFDPEYGMQPGRAQEQVAAVLPAKHRSTATIRTASYHKRSRKSHTKKRA
jgi:hypothetical protein